MKIGPEAVERAVRRVMQTHSLKRPCDPPCPVELCIEWGKAGMCLHRAQSAPPQEAKP